MAPADEPLPIGQAEILTQGNDLLIFAIGNMVAEAIEAQRRLLKEGFSATVVNCRFVKPINDYQIFTLARKIPRILTVEDGILQGGFGSAVLEALADQDIRTTQLKRIGIPDCFVEHGAADLLRSKYGLNAAGILSTAHLMLEDQHPSSIPNAPTSRVVGE